jgi:hypothetical protein
MPGHLVATHDRSGGDCRGGLTDAGAVEPTIRCRRFVQRVDLLDLITVMVKVVLHRLPTPFASVSLIVPATRFNRSSLKRALPQRKKIDCNLMLTGECPV